MYACAYQVRQSWVKPTLVDEVANHLQVSVFYRKMEAVLSFAVKVILSLTHVWGKITQGPHFAADCCQMKCIQLVLAKKTT